MIDRTAEFGAVAEVLREHGGIAPVAVARLAPRPPIHHQSLELAAAIRACTRRTDRLYRLAHRRGLFDDPAAEINELTGVVKADLGRLEALLKQLLSAAAHQAAGTTPPASAEQRASDAASGRFGASSARAHWLAVCEVLRDHVLSLMKRFQDSLRLRSENMMDQAQRRKQFARNTWAPLVQMDSPLFGGGAAGAGGPQQQLSGSASTNGGGNSGADASASTGTSTNGSGGGAATAALSEFSKHGPQLGARMDGSGRGGGGAAFSSPAPLRQSGYLQQNAPGFFSVASEGGLTAAGGAPGLRRRAGADGGTATAPSHAYGARAAAAFQHPAPPGGSSSFASTSAMPGGAPVAQPYGAGAWDGDPGTATAPSPYALRWNRVGGGGGYTSQQLAQYRTATTQRDDMREKEAQIVEIAHMFNRMATLVAEQGETVARIDADMTTSLDNVEAGNAELHKLYKSVSGNRRVILTVFGVVLLVILLYAAVAG